MKEARVQGLHRIQVRNRQGDISEAILEIRYRRIRVLPPIGKQKRYPELELTVLHAQEMGTPTEREKIDWKLNGSARTIPRGCHREAGMVCHALED
jgi:hypothetical protein